MVLIARQMRQVREEALGSVTTSLESEEIEYTSLSTAILDSMKFVFEGDGDPKDKHVSIRIPGKPLMLLAEVSSIMAIRIHHSTIRKSGIPLDNLWSGKE